MSLPDTPFVCESIDLYAAVIELAENGITLDEVGVQAVLAAALGETIPAEVETRAWCEVHDAQSWDGRDLFCLLHPGDPEERSCRMKRVLVIPFELSDLASEWQPVTGDSV